MEDMIQVVVVTIGTMASLAAIIKWGIEKYFKKSEEVMRLKEELNKKSIDIIEKSMTNVASEIITLGGNMHELEGHLIQFNNRLDAYDKQNNDIIKSYIAMSGEIKRKLKIFEDLELYEFKENTFVFKKKNH